MVADTAQTDVETLVARLAASGDASDRARLLQEMVDTRQAWEVAERLKEEADHARYQDAALALRWCGDIVTLGTQTGTPTVVALGHMAEALLLYDQGRYRDSLALFDEASALFRAHGDEVGWARTQIGRTVTCMALARFEEALQRAEEARAILDRAGEHLRVASIDNNLALLLERMNRPAEALAYGERALAAYRDAGSRYYAVAAMTNHALLLWRLGHVRGALEAYREARQGCVDLGADVDAARLDVNIGTVYLALGRYAEAVNTLTVGRHALLALGVRYAAAFAGLYLAECFVRMGRFREAIEIATTLRTEFAARETPVDQVQTLLWQSLAHVGLQEHDAALRVLNEAAAVVMEHQGLAAHGATVDVSRAQLLLATGRIAEARRLLEGAIHGLRTAGLAVDAAAAQLLLGGMLMEDHAQEAEAAAREALAIAEREGLDWLAARALHLQGQVTMRRGDSTTAWEALTRAVHRLDRVHRRVAWDDRAAFGASATALYSDTVALALQQERPEVALRYAERSKARGLADHLRGRIDVRPRVRDERSRALIDELDALRDRYAWLGAAHQDRSAESVAGAVGWAAETSLTSATRAEATRIERRMAEIWRELQVSNPAYRGEVAALDLVDGEEREEGDDDTAARRWLDGVHAALGSGDQAALLEYAAVGDDLVLFVVRAGQTHALRLPSGQADVNRLVALLRMNVARSADAVPRGGSALRALSANARGVLNRLYATLLAPAAPLLDGVTRLVVVPHGAGHHVPFHALHDGRHYLVEDVEVSYAPCAGLLEHFDERHRLLTGAGGDRARQALVLSCSDGGTLPHVRAEAQAVVAALGGRLLCEGGATLKNLRSLAGTCNVLHLAAHAQFRPDEPLFSSLQLCDGQLSTLEVFDLELNCALVALSACETALGVSGAGDELMGLSRAFLYAGAPSLLLSLWKVEDRSTAALMAVFYRALRQGASKTAALRGAQLALLHNEACNDVDCSAPFFWAPFELIGHAGPLPATLV